MTISSYSFKKESQVYLVYNGLQYNIDISDLTISQTTMEHSYSNKSIQEQNQFEQSVINKANPASFTLNVPALREADFKVLFDRSLDTGTFDLYIKTPADMFFVDNCVITSNVFVLEKTKPLRMKIEGAASQISRLAPATTIPGTIQARAGTMTYNRISDLYIALDISTILSDYLHSVTIELQNEIKWIPWTTVNNAISGGIMYPQAFTVSKKILSGSISQYIVDTNNANLLQWSSNSAFLIKAGQDVGGTLYGFTLNLSNCSFTNRITTGDIFTQNYDWRLLQNPADLATIITYTTI